MQELLKLETAETLLVSNSHLDFIPDCVYLLFLGMGNRPADIGAADTSVLPNAFNSFISLRQKLFVSK